MSKDKKYPNDWNWVGEKPIVVIAIIALIVLICDVFIWRV